MVLVGGGPRMVSVLERLAASLVELLGQRPMEVHVIDPYPAGGGRIWRSAQSPLLWMNSVAKDVTIFTDESVTCSGAIVAGPSLSEWVFGEGADRLERAGLSDHVRLLCDESGFASRAIQGEYLHWAFERVLSSLPEWVTVVQHRDVAIDVLDVGACHQVRLASGEQLTADVVILAQGHLDRSPTPAEVAHAAAADRHGLTYIGPGYTADVDLDDLRAGEPVLVSGFGLAFIDLMVLLCEGRGGVLTDGPDGDLHYEPSGLEPVLHVGSRRGVPYHAKLGYTVSGNTPAPPKHFTPEALSVIGDGIGPLDFDLDVRPLIDKELTAAHYARLFCAHPDRVIGPWGAIEQILVRTSVIDPEFVEAIEAAVPDPQDRFVIAEVDRPLAGARFTNRAGLAAYITDRIQTDLRRRADPSHSSDVAVFNALLASFVVLSEAITSGRITAADRVKRVEADFAGFFSFIASGPPPRRLRELLALHRAGIVHFVGPDLEVRVRDGKFVATSPAVPGQTRARAFVEARLPLPDAFAATDPVIRGLLDRGQIAAENLVAADGSPLGGGQLRADGMCRAVRGDGSAHPRLFLLGPAVSGSAGAAGFARPGFNGPGFRQNDLVARHILTLLAEPHTTASTSASKGHVHYWVLPTNINDRFDPDSINSNPT
jgi:hypothetical protein